MTNPVLENIWNRRSVRKFKEEPVAEETLRTIVEAGRFAPSGSNRQSTHFLVLQGSKALEELKAVVIGEFAKMDPDTAANGSVKNSIAASQTGTYEFYFKAPVLVLTANEKDNGNAYADCACALENMMLAAWSMGLGSCWVNQLRWLNENPVVTEYLNALGLKENEIVCGGLAIGHPAHVPSRPLERSGNPVTYIK